MKKTYTLLSLLIFSAVFLAGCQRDTTTNNDDSAMMTEVEEEVTMTETDAMTAEAEEEAANTEADVMMEEEASVDEAIDELSSLDL